MRITVLSSVKLPATKYLRNVFLSLIVEEFIKVDSFTVCCLSPRPQSRLLRSPDLTKPLVSPYWSNTIINSRTAMGLKQSQYWRCMNFCKQANGFCSTLPCLLDNSHSIYNATVIISLGGCGIWTNLFSSQGIIFLSYFAGLPSDFDRGHWKAENSF